MSGESFLSRWSKKKVESRTEEAAKSERSSAVTPTLPVPSGQTAPPEDAPVRTSSPASAVAAGASPPSRPGQPTQEPLPPIESLTHESDFRPFLKADVDPQLKNQALKTLFKDPHYNIMDGLDTYIDDYSKPDPIPESMLRQLNQSKMLRLFEDEEEDEKKQAEAGEQSAEQLPPTAPTAGAPATEKVVQNDAVETKSPTSINPDEIQHHQLPR